MEDRMNILYCGDSNIADGVLMSTLSISRHVSEPLNIYILTASIDDEKHGCAALDESFGRFLSSVLKKENAESTVRLIDVSELLLGSMPTANLGTRFTPCCMLRLFADEVECIPDRILYLDNDVICRGDITDFYNTDISGHDFAGVLDYYGSHFFYNGQWEKNYINSGVLLLNMRKIREDSLFLLCRKMCREKRMFMPDQSALNKLSHSKLILDRRYNEQRRQDDETLFRHFTTSFRLFPIFHRVSVKPWNEEGMHETLKLHEYDKLIAEYKRLKTISNGYTKEI